MAKVCFEYPKSGYLFVQPEDAKISFSLENTEGTAERFYISFSVNDYMGQTVSSQHRTAKIEAGQSELFEFSVALPQLGWFSADVEVVHNGMIVKESAEIGYTSPFERSMPEKALYAYDGVDGSDSPEMIANMGFSFVGTDVKTVLSHKEELDSNKIAAKVLFDGQNIYTNEAAAPFECNSAFYFARQYGDTVLMQDVSVEFDPSARSAKASCLAKLKANGSGLYGASEKRFDLNERKLMSDLGLYDYVSYLSLSYNSDEKNLFERDMFDKLVELGKWMDESGKSLPVALTLSGGSYEKIQYAGYLLRCLSVLRSLGVSRVFCPKGEKKNPLEVSFTDMVLCEFIRRTGNAKYVGDYMAGKGIFFKVFAQDNKFFALVWDITDGKTAGFSMPYISADYSVRDIMGNVINIKNDNIPFGRIPIYLDGLDSDIIEGLTDLTLFPELGTAEKSTPPDIILGISHLSDTEKERRQSARFLPGQTQGFEITVHNYSQETLVDTLIPVAPDSFCADVEGIPVSIPPMQSRKYAVQLSCKPVAPYSLQRFWAKLKSEKTAKVFYLVTVACPVSISAPRSEINIGDSIYLKYYNSSNETIAVNLEVESKETEFVENSFRLVIPADSERQIALVLLSCNEESELNFTLSVTDDYDKAVYELKP